MGNSKFRSIFFCLFLVFFCLMLSGLCFAQENGLTAELRFKGFLQPLENSQEKTLESIYKSGKVRFVPEIVLDDQSTPDDVFFEGYEHASSIVVDENDNVFFISLPIVDFSTIPTLLSN